MSRGLSRVDAQVGHRLSPTSCLPRTTRPLVLVRCEHDEGVRRAIPFNRLRESSSLAPCRRRRARAYADVGARCCWSSIAETSPPRPLHAHRPKSERAVAHELAAGLTKTGAFSRDSSGGVRTAAVIDRCRSYVNGLSVFAGIRLGEWLSGAGHEVGGRWR